tara:strand:+ start:1 stop:1158 length:1158 start_codon:yes stop_codon:yes gene_type:complete
MNKIGFLELIREEMEGFLKLEEREVMKKEGGEKILLHLPKFVPSEAWGTPNDESRRLIETYIRNIGGKGLGGKIKFIQDLQKGIVDGKKASRITSPRRIISTLIVLESLSAVLNSFSDSAAGFVFEGFLAALLGGYQQSERIEGNLPIQDVMAFTTDQLDFSKGTPMSLKLLSPASHIKGSYTNLVDAMNTFPEMVYVVATKEGKDVLRIGQFIISRENLVDIIDQRNPNLLKLPAKITRKRPANYLKSLPWSERYVALTNTSGYKKASMAMEDKEQLTEAKGPQWHLTPIDITSRMSGILEYKELGTLNLSEEDLRKTAQMYMEELRGTIMTMFEGVKDLSEHINTYFASKNRAMGIKSGEQAIQDAQKVQDATQESLEQEEEQ